MLIHNRGPIFESIVSSGHLYVLYVCMAKINHESAFFVFVFGL